MPSINESKPISWAEQVEQGEDGALPPTTEDFEEKTGIKIITEYKYNDEGKMVKVVKTYRVEKRKVSKSIARRKEWKKFGAAENDPPGPNVSNTIICEEVFMVFMVNKDPQFNADKDEEALAKLKNQKIVTCRICKGDHWTTRCPYKDSLAPLQESLNEDAKSGDAAETPGAATTTAAQQTRGKYVPPNQRDGAKRGVGESMANSKRGDETATIRVTNLSEDTRESDLQELFRPFGNIARIYLAKDKITGHTKGFAFINFYRKEDAARAIAGVSGFGYDHLILNVEWAKPSGTGT